MPRQSIQQNIKGGAFASPGNARDALKRDKVRAKHIGIGELRKAIFALEKAEDNLKKSGCGSLNKSAVARGLIRTFIEELEGLK